MRVTIVVAMATNRVIGRDGRLPWRLPSDLARFKALTMGHTLVMGRRTWDSIGKALPGRRSIVVSRRGAVAAPPEVVVVPSLEGALACARIAGENEAFVVGGASLYAEALALAHRAIVTLVDAEVEGDVQFPPVEWSEWVEVAREDFPAGERDDFDFAIVDLRRL